MTETHTTTFATYRAGTALAAIVLNAEELSAELARQRPTSPVLGPIDRTHAHLSSPEWLALFDVLSRRAESVERYNIATASDAGERIARLAAVYAGDKLDAARAWERHAENVELFPMRIDDTGPRWLDRRALASLRRIDVAHRAALSGVGA
jgi:hypothetical protein